MPSASAVRAGRAYVELFANQRQLQEDLNKALSRVKYYGEQAARFARTTISVSVIGTISLSRVINDFAKFDDKIRIVQATTRTTGEEFKRLENLARRLGRETSFTAQQVAEGMVILGRAGINAGDIQKVIDDFLNLSRATATELPRAIEIATATMRGFNMTAEQSSYIADVLTITANASAQSLDDLGEAFKYVVPIANSAGLSLKETAKATAMLANLGIKGSMAATGVRNILLRMSQTSVQKIYKEDLGIDVIDKATGKLRNLNDVMNDVAKSMENMPAATKIGIFREIFGMYGLASGSALASGIDMKDVFDKIDNPEGAAAQIAEQMDRGLGGAIRLAWSKIKDVGLTLGEVLEPSLMKARIAFEAFALKIQQFIKENGDSIRYFAEQFMRIFINIGKVISNVVRLTMYFKSFSTVAFDLLALVPHLYVIGKVLKSIANTVIFLNNVWTKLFSGMQTSLKIPKMQNSIDRINANLPKIQAQLLKRQSILNAKRIEEKNIASQILATETARAKELAKVEKYERLRQATLSNAQKAASAGDVVSEARFISLSQQHEKTRNRAVDKAGDLSDKLDDLYLFQEVAKLETESAEQAVKRSNATIATANAQKKRLALLIKERSVYAAIAAFGAIGLVAGGIYVFSQIMKKREAESIKKIIEERKNQANIEDEIYNSQTEHANEQIKRLEELNGIQNKTSAQMLEAKQIVASLTKTYGDLGLAVDEATGSIKGLEEAQAALPEKQREHQRSLLKTKIDIKAMEQTSLQSEYDAAVEEDKARRRRYAANVSAQSKGAITFDEALKNLGPEYDAEGNYQFYGGVGRNRKEMQEKYDTIRLQAKQAGAEKDILQDQYDALEVRKKEEEDKGDPRMYAKYNAQTAAENLKESGEKLFGKPEETTQEKFDSHVKNLRDFVKNTFESVGKTITNEEAFYSGLENAEAGAKAAGMFKSKSEDQSLSQEQRDAFSVMAETAQFYVDQFQKAKGVLTKDQEEKSLEDYKKESDDLNRSVDVLMRKSQENERNYQAISEYEDAMNEYYGYYLDRTDSEREELKKRMESLKAPALSEKIRNINESLKELMTKERDAIERLKEARESGNEEQIKSAEEVRDKIAQEIKSSQSEREKYVDELANLSPQDDVKKVLTSGSFKHREAQDQMFGANWQQKIFDINKKHYEQNKDTLGSLKRDVNEILQYLGFDDDGGMM